MDNAMKKVVEMLGEIGDVLLNTPDYIIATNEWTKNGRDCIRTISVRVVGPTVFIKAEIEERWGLSIIEELSHKAMIQNEPEQLINYIELLTGDNDAI